MTEPTDRPSIKLPPKEPGGKEEVLENVHSLVIVGANGAGKTRLGVYIEWEAPQSHRVAAQRVLTIPRAVQARRFREASDRMFTRRREEDAPVKMQADFDELLSLLDAQANKVARDYLEFAKRGTPPAIAPTTHLELLNEIWAKVMPQRRLVIASEAIGVRVGDGPPYAAGQMSDGERVCFYLIGQALCAPERSVIIIDEPEDPSAPRDTGRALGPDRGSPP